MAASSFRAQSPPIRRLAPAPAGTPLYVHLPFCQAKCTYCDFFSVPAEGQDVEGTLAALEVELQGRAPQRPRTVYLGGGTPSLLSIPQLEALLGRIEQLTGFRQSAVEFTAECNPESLDLDKARALLDLGVTRISLGFQSLRPEVLSLFGRVHSVEQSFRAFDAARRAGAGQVSVDLIFAVPGQSPEAWAEDLTRVLALGPDHVSAYNLTFEEETLFQRWLEQGRLRPQPEELELACFELTRELLGAHGLDGYEVSNFSRTGFHCQHNVNYWRNGDYLGVGPSAVSHVGGTRAGNPRNLGAWRRAVEREGQALAWSETLGPLERLGETWWLGLRLAEGVDPEEARERAGCSDAPAGTAAQLAEELLAQGLLQRSPQGRYSLSARGLPLADAVARSFLGLARVGAGA